MGTILGLSELLLLRNPTLGDWTIFGAVAGDFYAVFLEFSEITFSWDCVKIGLGFVLLSRVGFLLITNLLCFDFCRILT